MKDICIVPTVDNLDFHGSIGINAALHVIFLSDTISTPVQMIGHRPFGIQSDLPCMSWWTINYCNTYVMS